MEVKNEIVTTDVRVLSTKSFEFRIKEETLTKLINDKNKIRKRLNRGMRPIIDDITGNEWQESYNSLFEELLKMGDSQ